MLTYVLKNKFLRRILSVGALLILVVGSAIAVCLQPKPKVCAEFFKSDAVFVGTVVAQTLMDKDGYDGWVYRLRAKKVYRGPTQDVIEVYTGNDSARFPLDTGETYLLFAATCEKRLAIDCCGNSAKLSEASDPLHQLEELMRRIKSATQGEVSGVVDDHVGTDEPGIPGVIVTALEGGKRYHGVTGKGGWFHISVPPGEYVVSARFSKRVIIPYDLSYDDPKHAVVRKCGCTAIQFLAQ
jgi:hypothetical protein